MNIHSVIIAIVALIIFVHAFFTEQVAKHLVYLAISVVIGIVATLLHSYWIKKRRP